jgi:hypothetical protein
MFNTLRKLLRHFALRAPEGASVRESDHEPTDTVQRLSDHPRPIVLSQWEPGPYSGATRHAQTSMVIARSTWLQATAEADLVALRASLVATREHVARVQSHLRDVQATLSRSSRAASRGESGSGSANS